MLDKILRAALVSMEKQNGIHWFAVSWENFEIKFVFFYGNILETETIVSFDC